MRSKWIALLGLLAVLATAGVHANAAAFIAYDPYARYADANDVQGLVTYINHYNLSVDVRGREVPVTLHQGTVIRPRDTSLTPGMLINVAGYWGGGAFNADRIVVVRWP